MSKDALNTNGMPSRDVSSFSVPAMLSTSAWLSMTHGPAIRKNGWSMPDLEPGELHAPAACGSSAARCARAARTKPVNSGCPSRGVDVNSGWNCEATNHGWLGSSIISTSPSREKPEKRRPALRSRSM